MEDSAILIEAVHTLGQLSYWGIFGISLLANIIIPVPEEVFLLALGYVSGAEGVINPYITAAIVIPGLMVSDLFLYTLARTGNKYVKVLERKLKNFKFTRDHSFVEKHIVKIVVISRFVIQFRFVGPVLAGTTKMSWKKFLVWDFIALCFYVPLVIFIGNYFNARITKVLTGIAVAKNYVLLAVGVLIVWWLAKFIRRQFFKEFIFHVHEKEGYIDTWVPGIRRKMHSHVDDHFEKIEEGEPEEK